MSLRSQLNELRDVIDRLLQPLSVEPEPDVVRGMDLDAEEFIRLTDEIQPNVMRVFEE